MIFGPIIGVFHDVLVLLTCFVQCSVVNVIHRPLPVTFFVQIAWFLSDLYCVIDKVWSVVTSIILTVKLRMLSVTCIPSFIRGLRCTFALVDRNVCMSGLINET